MRTLTELKAGAANGARKEGEEGEVVVDTEKDGGTEEQENQGRQGRGKRVEDGAPAAGGGGGGSGGRGRERERSAEVVVREDDPAVLVVPPRVGDGKLEHDKERRLGVASDLEAVIAVSVSL